MACLNIMLSYHAIYGFLKRQNSILKCVVCSIIIVDTFFTLAAEEKTLLLILTVKEYNTKISFTLNHNDIT